MNSIIKINLQKKSNQSSEKTNPWYTKNTLAIIIPLFLIFSLCILFGIMNVRFFSISNIYNLVRQSSILFIVALGMSFVILIGGIDLSVGAIISLSGIVSAMAVPFCGYYAIFIGILVGGVAGFLSGFIYAYGKVPSFLVTLSMGPILNGIALLISKGSPICINNLNYIKIVSGRYLGNFPNIGLWAIVIYLICVFIILKTRFSRYSFAVGAGEKAAIFSGVNTKIIKVKVLLMSGLLSGLAGVLFAARVQAGVPQMGESFTLDAITATVIGGTALTGGVGGPHKTILGVIIIGILNNGMNLTGVHPYIQIIIKGVITIIAVAVSLDRSKFQFVK